MSEDHDPKPSSSGDSPGKAVDPAPQEARTEALTPRERRLENLKPYWWKKGQSGNPQGGRLTKVQRTMRLTQAVVDAVEKQTVTVKEGGESKTRTIPEAIALRLVQLAINEGDVQAMKLLREMIDREPDEGPRGTVTPDQVEGIVRELVPAEAGELADEIVRRVREAAAGVRVTIRYEE